MKPQLFSCVAPEVTYFTDILVSMVLNVRLKGASFFALKATNATRQRPVPSVIHQVQFQLVGSAAHVVAGITSIRLLASVCLHMSLQVMGTAERLGAELAGVGFLSSVGVYMTLQVMSPGKTAVANVTDMRSFPSVSPKVSVELTRCVANVVTLCTSIYLILFVTVQMCFKIFMFRAFEITDAARQ